MVELPGWIKTLPVGVTLAADDLSSQLLDRFAALTDERAAPGTRSDDQHWSIRWPSHDLSVRVFADGITEESAAGLNYRPSLERLLSKHSPNGVAVWGIGFEKQGIFLSTYDDVFRSWVKGELTFSPTVVVARDVDIVMIADEQMRFSVVGGSSVLIGEMDAALGGESAINEAFGAFVDNLGIGFGELDRAWAIKFFGAKPTRH